MTEDIPGLDYSRASMLRVQADDAVAFLEPMRAILSKDDDIVFIIAPDKIRVRMRDIGSIALIDAEVDIQQAQANGNVTDAILKEGIVMVRFDRFLTAVKSFGDENVAIVAGKDRMFIQSDFARRTMPLIYSDDWAEPKMPQLSLDFSSFADMKVLKRAADVDVDNDMGDCVILDVKEDGVWSVSVGEDRDMSEVMGGRGTNDSQERIRTAYSKDYVLEILRRVKVDSVRISANKDMPMEMEYYADDYRVTILLAPKIKR